MYRKILIVFIAVFSLSSALYADKSNFDKAADLYKNKDYLKAADLFKKEAKDFKLTGEIAFNTGNCFFKAKKYSKALLWYKKAEKYLFYDNDLNFNIKSCLNKLSLDKNDQYFLSDKVFFADKYLSEFFINLLSLIFFSVFLFLFLFKKTKFMLSIKVFTFILSFYFISSCINNYLEYNINQKGIVLKKSEIYSAYSEKASVLFELPAGCSIAVKKKEKGFFKIITPDKRPGWIKAENAGIL
ncbi:MAG: tetratricopeptide repeat protein [Thermodesulfobacteriota bacterium]